MSVPDSRLTPDRSNGQPDKDQIYQLLADDRRRTILDLLDAAGPLSRDELADRLAAREGVDKESVVISLYHHHLPKLEQLNVITRTGTTVRLGAGAPLVLKMLRASQRARITQASSP